MLKKKIGGKSVHFLPMDVTSDNCSFFAEFWVVSFATIFGVWRSSQPALSSVGNPKKSLAAERLQESAGFAGAFHCRCGFFGLRTAVLFSPKWEKIKNEERERLHPSRENMNLEELRMLHPIITR